MDICAVQKSGAFNMLFISICFCCITSRTFIYQCVGKHNNKWLTKWFVSGFAEFSKCGDLLLCLHLMINVVIIQQCLRCVFEFKLECF